MSLPTPFEPVSRPVRTLFFFLVPIAMLAGLYGRFKGIGTWPLGVDEFYTARSIDHVLLMGVPRFPCGGYYTRGLLFQYIVAGLRWSGLPSELAGRSVAAICSVAVWPAAYLIARRLQGQAAGWLVVIILALSVWEIEMARFYRMYAPFQAVFTWYVVLYLRYTVDGHRAALWPMIVLSVVGALTWEGGALLGVANLLAVLSGHEHGRWRRADWVRAAALLVLLVLLFAVTRDLRGSQETAVAARQATAGGIGNHARLAVAALSALRRNLVWGLAFLLPLGAGARSMRWIASYRRAPLTAAALCAAIAAAAAHSFALTAGALILALLLRLIDWRRLCAREARWYWLALGAFLVYWLLFARFHLAAADGPHPSFSYLFEVPDVFDHIARPWVRAVPILSIELAIAACVLLWRAIAIPRDNDPTANLLSLVLLLVLAVGAIPTGRLETRYTFFLYPLLVALAVSLALALVRRPRILRRAPVIAVLIPLLGFAASEDFQPRHVMEIDSAESNFRIGLSAARADHYYERNDMRGVAQWLAGHVEPGDMVISGIPNLDPYYHAFGYFYLGADEARYDAYICADGRTERWTDHPVLHGLDELKSLVQTQTRVYATVYPDIEPQLRAEAASAGWQLTRAWTAADGQTHVLLIVPHGDGGS
jgi:hypothetical protein